VDRRRRQKSHPPAACFEFVCGRAIVLNELFRTERGVQAATSSDAARWTDTPSIASTWRGPLSSGLELVQQGFASDQNVLTDRFAREFWIMLAQCLNHANMGMFLAMERARLRVIQV